MVIFCPILSFSQKTFSELKSIFDNAYANPTYGRSEMLSYSNTDGSKQEYYYMNWNLNAVISAWQATGDISYFNDAKQVIDNTISNASTITVNGQNFKGWPEPGHSTGFELWDSMYWKEVATFLRVIYQSPNFLSSQTNWFNSVLAFTERNIWERYEELGEDGYQYGHYPDTASHWARIAMELYIITGKQKYKTFFDNASFKGCECSTVLNGSSIRDQIFNNNSVSPTANNISWTWGQTTSGETPDSPHVSALVQFVALAAENGMHWNQGSHSDDIAKWVSTFENVVWTEISPAKASFYIDGSGRKDAYSLSQGAQAILGRFDSDFQVRMENYILDDIWNKAMVSGLLLLNRKILNDGAPVYPENYNNPDIDEPTPPEEEEPEPEEEEQEDPTPPEEEEPEPEEEEQEEPTPPEEEEPEPEEEEQEEPTPPEEEEPEPEEEEQEDPTPPEEEDPTPPEEEEPEPEEEEQEDPTPPEEEEPEPEEEEEEEEEEDPTPPEEEEPEPEEEEQEDPTPPEEEEPEPEEEEQEDPTPPEEEEDPAPPEEEEPEPEEDPAPPEEESEPEEDEEEDPTPEDQVSIPQEEPISIEEDSFGLSKEPPNVRAYPNPTNGEFTVLLPAQTKQTTFTMFSINGTLIDSGIVPDGQTTLKMEIKGGPRGLYILNVNNIEGQIETLKIIKN